MKKDRVFLMDVLLAPSGLYGDAINSIVDRYQEARKQAAAFKLFLPRRSVALGAAGQEKPQPCNSSLYREVQKQNVASRAPPQRDRGWQRSKNQGLLRRGPIWGSCFGLGSPRRSGPDIHKLRTTEGGPYWGRAVCTVLHGVHLSSAPSEDRSANPASVPGCSDLQRVFL